MDFDQNTFEYDASGIRIRKNGTEYELDGTTIVEEKRTGTVIRYRYGVEGMVGFTYNGTDYYYTKDLFGNISGIYGADGTRYAAYEYDAWGNHTVTLNVNGIGSLNPFRYRGYYYDTETGLYYLQTRYYDPVTGRFLNADVTFDTNAGLTAYNLFAYCGNCPVMHVDISGLSYTSTRESNLAYVVSVSVVIVGVMICVQPSESLISGFMDLFSYLFITSLSVIIIFFSFVCQSFKPFLILGRDGQTAEALVVGIIIPADRFRNALHIQYRLVRERVGECSVEVCESQSALFLDTVLAYLVSKQNHAVEV